MTPSSESGIFRRIADVEKDVAVAKNDHVHLLGSVGELTQEVHSLRLDMQTYRVDKGFVFGVSTAVSSIIGLGFMVAGLFWGRK